MCNAYRMAKVRATDDGRLYWAILENDLDTNTETIVEKYDTRHECSYWFLTYYEV